MKGPASIRILPDAVINQIAAGEVVERPASVLKELAENSLDAGARRIEIEVVDGGRRLVRVRDDGCGMDRDNALLSLERHATSKLRDIRDLDSIVTLGFRGEALAAIAAVSQLTLLTNTAGSAVGTEILVFGGKIQEVRDAGVPPGTEVTVRNLFFNVPARRKFLRSAATEFAHIRQTFLLGALANPSVAYVLRADDEEVYQLPPAEHLGDRIRDVYGEEVFRHLRPIQFGNGTVELRGYAGAPPYSRMDRELQVVFVNGRPAGSPVIQFAIQSAYRDVLPGGRYAPVFLCIDLPPELVDVNVHPAKKEVRFRRPTEVRDVILEGLRMALAGPEIVRNKRSGWSPSGGGGVRAGSSAVVAPEAAAAKPSEPLPPPPQAQFQTALQLSSAEPAASTSQAEPAAAPWSDYRLIGRVGGIYALLETAEGLVLMDSRSAHERVLFERFLRAMEQGKVPAQGLLPPAIVQTTPAQTQALQKHRDWLRQLGFGLAEFGSDSFLVDALPVWVAGASPGPLISDIADGLMQGGKGALRDWALPLVAGIAGRQAVGLQRELTEPELHALIRDLARTQMPYTSPRGKPTVILFSYRELNRKFGRE